MTNREKFKEVFGFTPREFQECVLPIKICEKMGCEKCPFDDWWNKEYQPCFQMREDFER